MSRTIDFDKPLSDEDKRWLHERSLDWRIEENERRFGQREVYENEGIVKVEIPGLVDPEPSENPRAPTGESLKPPPVVVVEEVVDVAELTVKELKEHLSDLGLSTEGNKKELQERLDEAL